MSNVVVFCFGLEDIFVDSNVNQLTARQKSLLAFLKSINGLGVNTVYLTQNENINRVQDLLKLNNIEYSNENIMFCEYPDAFLNSSLQKHLEDSQVTHVITLGKLCPMSMEATSYKAYFLGYQVITLDDLLFSESKESISDLIAWLNLYFGIVYSSQDAIRKIEDGSIYEVKDIEIP